LIGAQFEKHESFYCVKSTQSVNSDHLQEVNGFLQF